MAVAVASDRGLELSLNKATNPLNNADEWEEIQRFCSEVNKELEGPQYATRLLSHKIQSPQEWEAMQGLTVLEACMRNCGARFHTEVGKYRFLNELIKVLSPKYLGARSTAKVKNKIVELMYSWTVGISNETKIQDAYKMLKRQGVIQQDPKLPNDNQGYFAPPPPPPPRPSNPLFEDEEKSKLLARLLKSGHPDDLDAANRLIKTMVKEDQTRMEKITKRIGALKSVEECTHTLSEMVARHRHIKASTEEFDSMKLSLVKLMVSMVIVLKSQIVALMSPLLRQWTLNAMIVTDGGSSVVSLGDGLHDPVIGSPVTDAFGSLEDSTAQLSLALSLALALSRSLSRSRSRSRSLSVSLSLSVLAFIGGGRILSLCWLSRERLRLPFALVLALASREGWSLRSLFLFLFVVVALRTAALHAVSAGGSSSEPWCNVERSCRPREALSPACLAPEDGCVRGVMPTRVLLETRSTITRLSRAVWRRQASPVTESEPSRAQIGGLAELEQIGRNMLQKSIPACTAPVTWSSPPIKLTLREMQSKAESHSPSHHTTLVPTSGVASPRKTTTDISLANVFVPLESIKPSSSLPVTAYDGHGLRVLLHFAREPPLGRSDVLVVVLSLLSTAPLSVQRLLFQAAVPKSMRVKLQPPSGTELPPFNPLVPPSAITQVMLLANPNKEKVRLRYKLTFLLGEESHSEVGEVDSFPVTADEG
uniref:ADP-ribosylation factor-binding protein GGA1-like n=1 Tax=Myxine glutinosa TaxID=7769 RepID=UPI00358F7CFB